MELLLESKYLQEMEWKKIERTISIESDHLAVAKKDNDDQIKIINDATRIRLIDILKGKKVSKGNCRDS